MLNPNEFNCYMQVQNSSMPGTVLPCSVNFLKSSQKSFLLTTNLNQVLYSDKIEALAPPNSFIVIDNTQFPKSLTTAPYFLGAYQPLPINIDIYIRSNYEISEVYYQIFLACKYYSNSFLFLNTGKLETFLSNFLIPFFFQLIG